MKPGGHPSDCGCRAGMAELRNRLSRARYFRGHGVHSPFVYTIVREVFMRRELLPGDGRFTGRCWRRASAAAGRATAEPGDPLRLCDFRTGPGGCGILRRHTRSGTSGDARARPGAAVAGRTVACWRLTTAANGRHCAGSWSRRTVRHRWITAVICCCSTIIYRNNISGYESLYENRGQGDDLADRRRTGVQDRRAGRSVRIGGRTVGFRGAADRPHPRGCRAGGVCGGSEPHSLAAHVGRGAARHGRGRKRQGLPAGSRSGFVARKPHRHGCRRP